MNRRHLRAALLNYFIWGLGYLYLGRRRRFGVILLVGYILIQSAFVLSYSYEFGRPIISQDVDSLGLIVVGLAFGYDAYHLPD
jgi:hypothetical protein